MTKYLNILLFMIFISKNVYSFSEKNVEINVYNSENYDWLFEKLIPEQDRIEHPEQSINSFKVHLEDSFHYFPDPGYLSGKHLNWRTKIVGELTYIGFVPKKYKYDVIYNLNSRQVTLSVKVFFINATENDLDIFKDRFSQAEKNWNSSLIPLDFKYSFQFEVVNDPFSAHFSVWLLDDTRGPYDLSWNRNWGAVSVAHELGHMLGLGDEYETLTSESNCLSSSIMCSSFYGAPMKAHYYFILRRLMK